MDLYVVTADTYTDFYGAEITLFGVFDTEEKAIECVEELKGNNFRAYLITKTQLNKNIEMYLGGYYE